MRKFLLGVLTAYLLLGAIAVVGIQRGWVQAAADRKPGKLEEWAAMHALHRAIRRDSGGLQSPLPVSDATLLEGARVYEASCLVCHGAADGKPSAIARGLNVSPPQLATDGVEDDPEGETYWKVKHGIRFTAMPAYGGALTEEDLWAVALFVSRLDKLPAAAEAAWKAMPSAAEKPRP